MPRKPAKHYKREGMSKRGKKTFRRMESQQQAERTAMERQGQAKARGIKNPPDIQVLSKAERLNLKGAEKRAKHETGMAEYYAKKGQFGFDDPKKTARVKKDIADSLAAKKAEARRRSEKRKKESSDRYRKGVKAY
jgi:hypothetical protein